MGQFRERVISDCIFLTVITTLLVLYSTDEMCGQHSSGYFKYGLMMVRQSDSVKEISEKDRELADYIAHNNAFEIYFNKLYLAVVNSNAYGITRRVYNRKSKILYKFDDQQKKVKIDSVYWQMDKDPRLKAIVDSVQTGFLVDENYSITKYFLGFKCHQMTRGHYELADTAWISNFIDVPDLIFSSVPGVGKGIPLSITFNLDGLLVTFGVITYISSLADNEDVFQVDRPGYTESQEKTEELLRSLLNMIKSE
jgi:hypothetical protein